MTSVARSRPQYTSSNLSNLVPVDSSYLNRAISTIGSSSSADHLQHSHHSHQHVPYPVRQFATYDDYLDSLVQPLDVKYLESDTLQRRLIELGSSAAQPRGAHAQSSNAQSTQSNTQQSTSNHQSAASSSSHHHLSRDEFNSRKRELNASTLQQQQLAAQKQQQQQQSSALKTHHEHKSPSNEADDDSDAAAEFDSSTQALDYRPHSSSSAAAHTQLNVLNAHFYPSALARSPFLHALAAREHALRSGKLITIVFIRTTNARGQEVSGYIDVAQRWFANSNAASTAVSPNDTSGDDMSSDPIRAAIASGIEFALILAGEAKLVPRSSDLSYYNWSTQYACINQTANFTVKSDSLSGLMFKNKRDRKIISVDPNQSSSNGDSATQQSSSNNESSTEQRQVIDCSQTNEYEQAVFYDRSTRYH